MNFGVLAVLACLALPIALAVALIVHDARHNRHIQRSPTSVASIRSRVARERAEVEAADAPTEVLPVIHPALDMEPTEVLPLVLPPRPRPYVGRAEAAPRCSSERPDPEVVVRVLRGLRRFPARPSAAATPRQQTDNPDSTGTSV
ncbi:MULTISPECIES: hypothetical protein [Amycolatopsis]|uniref:Secreted protein n=1 Tax=Amycolatopsis bullii TaxID=941987 RepID=A0ABQ3KNT7_9PSEU|nr:hypothetical protein [Amycolatopsis bullii]GHG29942.1 hypothetical protein GCM10017567_57180 [Amycolatopsis bullii]